jgi:hypothetical protein
MMLILYNLFPMIDANRQPPTNNYICYLYGRAPSFYYCYLLFINYHWFFFFFIFFYTTCILLFYTWRIIQYYKICIIQFTSLTVHNAVADVNTRSVTIFRTAVGTGLLFFSVIVEIMRDESTRLARAFPIFLFIRSYRFLPSSRVNQ